MNITAGPFNSVTIAVIDSRITPEELGGVIAEKKITTKGAVYITIPAALLSQYHHMIHCLGVKFHHFTPSPIADPIIPGAGIYTYYLWNVYINGKLIEDQVPHYATSIEGIGALILSPDEQKVLLVWEYGKWKLVTGALKAGESPVGTLEREIMEEVGLSIDPHTIKRIGGWHIAKARYDLINDNFTAFAVRATSEQVQVDGIEIKDAHWFNLKELATLVEPQLEFLMKNYQAGHAVNPTSVFIEIDATGNLFHFPYIHYLPEEEIKTRHIKPLPKGSGVDPLKGTVNVSWIGSALILSYLRSLKSGVAGDQLYVSPDSKYTLYI